MEEQAFLLIRSHNLEYRYSYADRINTIIRRLGVAPMRVVWL